MELADLQPAAGRVLGVHAAGQLQPVVPAGRRSQRHRDVRPDSIRSSPASRRGRTSTPRGCTPTRLRVVRHRRAQPQDGPPGADRRFAGAVRDSRRHRAVSCRTACRSRFVWSTTRAGTRSPASIPGCTCRIHGRSAASRSTRAALRALRHVDSGAERRRRRAGCPHASSPSRRTSSTGTRSRRDSVSPGTCSATARTAIKGGLSRYDRLAGITLVQPLNQKNIAFQTCPWDDTQRRPARAGERNRVRALLRIAPAEPRLRGRGTEAPASVGIHRHRAAADRRPHVGDASATSAADSGTFTRRSTTPCR